ncbi:MAG: adenylate/guanylate cyclase domain-containing protein [Pseudomonadota bacterium]
MTEGDGQSAVTLGRRFLTVEQPDDGPRDVADRLFRRLLDAGVPLHRANISLTTLHPELTGYSYRWTRDSDETVKLEGRRQQLEAGLYARSPYKLFNEDGYGGIRRRLDMAGEMDDLGVLDDMREMGATDYVAMAASAGVIGGLIGTWTTDRPGGFTTDELVVVERELLAAAADLENRNLRVITRNLLETYVGRRAGARVLTGEISRGSGETLKAVIWMSDLRGFTALSDTLPRDRLIALLNQYYDQVITPIEAYGGEVIKFIGDGVLAIFPTDIEGGAQAACQAAMTATDEALAAIAERNREAADDEPEMIVGVVLHLGDVSFGNVGAARRLDFTVIGPAVNLASRLERLCSETGEPVLLSDAVAKHAPSRAELIGDRTLRGLSRPQTVYRLRLESNQHA